MAPLAAEAAADTVRAYLAAGRLGEAIQLGQQQLALAEQAGQRLAVAPLALVLAQAAGHVGQYQWSQSLGARARRLYDRAGDLRQARWAMVYWAVSIAELGRKSQARSTLGQTLVELERDSNGPTRAFDLAVFQCLAAGLWLDGTTPDALDRTWYLAQAALHSAQTNGPSWVAMVSLAYLTTVHLHLGERARALIESNRGMSLLEKAGEAAGHEPLLYFTHAQALRVQGDGRALWYRQRARQTLAWRAMSLHERRLRCSYLHDVRLNRAIGRH